MTAAVSNRSTRTRLTVVAVAAAATITGCGTDGTATQRAGDALVQEYIRLQEKPYVKDAGDEIWPRLLGIHLAESLPFLSDLDPGLDVVRQPTQPFRTPYQAQLVVMPQLEHLPAMRDLRYGFVVSAGSTADSAVDVRHAVLVFTGAAAAARAADALTDVLVDSAFTDYERRPVRDLPTSSVTVRSGPRHRTDGATSTVALTPVGRSLVFTRASSPDREWTSQIVADAYRAQKPMLESRPPEPTDRAIDPTGILTGTIAMPTDQIDLLHQPVYGPRATALFYDDQGAAYRAIQAAGIDLFGWNRSSVYRTAGADRTAGWIDFLIDDFQKRHPTARTVPGPAESGGARCVSGDDGATCLLAVGRYVGATTSSRLPDARAQIAAVATFLDDFDA